LKNPMTSEIEPTTFLLLANIELLLLNVEWTWLRQLHLMNISYNDSRLELLFYASVFWFIYMMGMLHM
jgi:hypothetical protein